MRSVLVAQKRLIEVIQNKMIFDFEKVKQNKKKELRYSKNRDFTDKIANEFLQRNMKINSMELSYPELIRPIFG